MPPLNRIYLPDIRPKVLHSQGVIARAKLVIRTDKENPYTGLFKSGCDECFLRLSTPKPIISENLIPALSMKFLRDRVHSANIMGLYSLLGQQERNFFAHDLTNHLPGLPVGHTPFDLGLLKFIFQFISKYESMIGVSEIARYDQKGVRSEEPNFPYRLIFHPTKKIHKIFRKNFDENIPYLENMLKFEPQVIFELYIQATPESKAERLGHIETTTKFDKSLFADKYLFFQHTRMEDDLKIKPEWVAPTEKLLEDQRKHEFTYSDVGQGKKGTKERDS